jgi:hypothetical protein
MRLAWFHVSSFFSHASIDATRYEYSRISSVLLNSNSLYLSGPHSYSQEVIDYRVFYSYLAIEACAASKTQVVTLNITSENRTVIRQSMEMLVRLI